MVPTYHFPFCLHLLSRFESKTTFTSVFLKNADLNQKNIDLYEGYSEKVCGPQPKECGPQPEKCGP